MVRVDLGRGPRGLRPLLFPQIYSKSHCNQQSFEQYCAIRIVLWVWGKVALLLKFFWPPVSDFSGSSPDGVQ